MDHAPIEFDAARLENLLASSRTAVVVVFQAPWCSACRAMTPIVAQLAADLADRAVVATVDIDAHPRLAARFDIVEVPCTLICHNGNVVDRITGPASVRQVMARITKVSGWCQDDLFVP